MLTLEAPYEVAVDYVLVAVQITTREEVAARMGTVIDLAHRHGGSVDCGVSGVLIITFGALPYPHGAADAPARFVDQVRADLAQDIRVVRGSERGWVGEFGSEQYAPHTFLVPGLLDALSALSECAFGEVRNLPGVPSC